MHNTWSTLVIREFHDGNKSRTRPTVMSIFRNHISCMTYFIIGEVHEKQNRKNRKTKNEYNILDVYRSRLRYFMGIVGCFLKRCFYNYIARSPSAVTS